MKIVTAAEMREIDRLTTEKYGVPSLTLMENAGTAVARFVLEKFKRLRRATIFCGKGNNGGDGFVVARKLGDEGRRVTVILLADPSELKGDAAEMFRRMRNEPLIIRTSDDLKSEAVALALKTEVILDAILGTGFRPPVTGLYAEAIGLINKSKRPVVAVDIPSGADADAFQPADDFRARADYIVTFTAPRPAHVFGALTQGDTVVAPIGSPEEAIRSSLNLFVITPRDFASFLADRNPDGHKGTYGHVLIVGGSVGKSGAAAMAGLSALRSGAGLSTVATPRSALNAVAAFTPELMTEPMAETEEGSLSPLAYGYGRVQAVMEGKDVVAVGPGVGRDQATEEFVRSFVQDCRVPVVLDADGLNAFADHSAKLSGAKRPLVLTPHPGEMSRLTGMSTKQIQQDRIGIARRFAGEHQCIVVLKGHRTIVALPDGAAWVNVTGNPGMATGGTGDVLTGITSGLMAQTRDYSAAVIASVYLHGSAGDVAREKVGEASLIATDVIAGLPEGFKRAKQALSSRSFVFHG
jgi:ADP-dependent NAD(P)H-hydrate dehydratase / NAD(P)H-hydrate epimerase